MLVFIYLNILHIYYPWIIGTGGHLMTLLFPGSSNSLTGWFFLPVLKNLIPFPLCGNLSSRNVAKLPCPAICSICLPYYSVDFCSHITGNLRDHLDMLSLPPLELTSSWSMPYDLMRKRTLGVKTCVVKIVSTLPPHLYPWSMRFRLRNSQSSAGFHSILWLGGVTRHIFMMISTVMGNQQNTGSFDMACFRSHLLFYPSHK